MRKTSRFSEYHHYIILMFFLLEDLITQRDFYSLSYSPSNTEINNSKHYLISQLRKPKVSVLKIITVVQICFFACAYRLITNSCTIII
jgi:hypothetical protein